MSKLEIQSEDALFELNTILSYVASQFFSLGFYVAKGRIDRERAEIDKWEYLKQASDLIQKGDLEQFTELRLVNYSELKD